MRTPIIIAAGAMLWAGVVGVSAMSVGEFGGVETRVVWTIHADGKSEMRTETVMPRAVAEQYVRMMEQFEQLGGMDFADEEAEPGADVSPMTDEVLAEKLRAAGNEGLMGGVEGIDLESLTVGAEGVRSVVRLAHDTLEEAVSRSHTFIAAAGPGFSRVRLSVREESLEVVFSSDHGARELRQLRQMWQAMGANFEFKLVLPGRVTASGFPETEGNATWVKVNSQDSSTLDAALKLAESPVVVTAESGGLQLEAPLDSRALRMAGVGGIGSDIPITEAGPGYVAEALSVTTTTVHYFPEGEALVKAGRWGVDETPGVSVQARLFAPRGRSVISGGAVTLLEAVDDKGNSLLAAVEDGGETDDFGLEMYSYGGRRSESASVQMDLRLPLPGPDTASIEEVVAESIVVTAGSWKEKSLEKITADTEKSIDLSELAPGASLIVESVETQGSSTSVRLRVEGPAAIREFSFDAGRGNPSARQRSGVSSYTSGDNVTQRGETVVRKVALRLHTYGDEQSGDEPVWVSIRRPEDLRRERVKFTLNELDLF